MTFLTFAFPSGNRHDGSLASSVLVVVVLSTLASSTLAADWKSHSPGGDTICAKGGEFTFFYHEGYGENKTKLVVEFEGGGACWNDITCAVVPTYTQSIDKESQLAALNARNSGIHDHDADQANSDLNPYRGWFHVFIPYCTGDVHVGNKTTTYLGTEIHHRGSVNRLAVMDWVTSHPKASTATEIGVTGCSAGSLGQLLNMPFVFDRFPDVTNQVAFGDSFIGVIGAPQFTEGRKNWDLQIAPQLGIDLDLFNDDTHDFPAYVLTKTLRYYSKARVGMYTSNADVVQESFYALGGGTGDWTNEMRSNIANVTSTHDISSRFTFFIAPGNAHCRSQDDGFYAVKSGFADSLLVDWTSRVVDGEGSQKDEVPPGVDCIPDCAPASFNAEQQQQQQLPQWAKNAVKLMKKKMNTENTN